LTCALASEMCNVKVKPTQQQQGYSTPDIQGKSIPERVVNLVA
jgi:hypothetical protein